MENTIGGGRTLTIRLIDADERIFIWKEAMLYMLKGDYGKHPINMETPIEDLENAPTIEAEPIKHGRWERYYYSYFGRHQCVCSECKDSEYWKKYYCYGVESYCPNCGAKMDLEVKE